MFCGVILVIALAVIVVPSQAIVYDKCTVASDLRNQGVPEDQISTWVCIAHAESAFDTTAINSDTWDYGIFQISSIYWCSNSDQPGNGCGITCSSLLDDDITNDIACVRLVYAQTEAMGETPGFRAWTTYEPYCAGDNSDWVSAFIAIPTQAVVYNKCDVAWALRQQGVPEWQVATWVCIANAESRFDTTAVNQNTWDYGIFQISQLYWCNPSDQPGKGCGITCNSLLDDDITNDIACVRKVYDETERIGQTPGFKAWTTYGPYCSGDNSQWIAGC